MIRWVQAGVGWDLVAGGGRYEVMQAEKDGSAEGFSIPARREANPRKADQLGATIVAQFVEAGESARKADRSGLCG